jgi:hypothetical protein
MSCRKTLIHALHDNDDPPLASCSPQVAGQPTTSRSVLSGFTNRLVNQDARFGGCAMEGCALIMNITGVILKLEEAGMQYSLGLCKNMDQEVGITRV